MSDLAASQEREPTCALCGRAGTRLTRHHLLPRSRARKAKRRGRDVEAQAQRIAPLCPACHAMVHATLSEKELQQSYGTIEALLNHPDIARFVQWVRKQPPASRIRVRRPEGRR